MKQKDSNKPILINSDHLAIQSNEFIEAKYKESLTFWESFLITKMCSMISHDDIDFKPYRIYFKEVIDFMGLTPSGHVYNYIMDAAKRLLDRKIVIGVLDEYGRKEIIDTHIVTSVRRLAEPPVDGNMYVTLTFLPELKPFLLQLQKDFTKLDMEIYKKLKTASSIRLYQIFKSHIGKNHHKIQFDLEELKEILGVSQKYQQYAGFKMRVLDEAQKRLSESTDIRFTYEEIKVGKKVSAIIFYLNNNKTQVKELLSDTVKKLETTQTSEVEQEKLVMELSPIVVKKFGVSLKVFMTLVEQYTEGDIKQAIRVTEKTLQSKKIENIAGFFVEALRGHYVDAQDVKKQTNTELKAKATEIKRVEEVANQKNIQDKKAQYEREIGILKQLIKNNPQLVTQLIEKVRYSLSGSYYQSDKTFEENMAHPLLNAAILNAAKELLPEQF